MSNWSDDLKKITEGASLDLGDFCRAIKIELFSGIVEDTRVDTGRLKANWQIQDDEAPKGSLNIKSKDGGLVLKKIEAKATTDGRTYFVNNLPYAIVWEEKDAMIAKNVARIRQIVAEQAREY